jgi:hypothetical protein
MARAGEAPDFSSLEARVKETQTEVRRVFLTLLGCDLTSAFDSTRDLARGGLP